MNLSSTEAGRWLDEVRPLAADLANCELFVLPPFTAIWLARDRLGGSRLAWGAQDVHWAEDGAHTGDVSAAMLADLGCTYVEVGHSERRRDHGESDDEVARKAAQVIRHGMTPILCVGEPHPGRPEAAIGEVVGQLERSTSRLHDDGRRRLVVAYEPVWAIGAGAQPATPDHIGIVQRALKAQLGIGPRVIYGGSVDRRSAGPILAQEGVDGLFVGRAALDSHEFAAIARLADEMSGAVAAG